MGATACRVIVDSEPRSGSVNMAIDAALLRAADETPAGPVVRLYQWSAATVSLGYFQKSDQSSAAVLLPGCPRVRRLTGGGAILHHHEVTYSCVIPRNHRLRKNPLQLYGVMHSAILNLLAAHGATTGFRADLPGFPIEDNSRSVGEHEPFLCFLRSDPRDLAAMDDGLSGNPKVVGSAQRRRRGTILQHGSILLRHSSLMPEVLGLCDLFPDFDLASFLNALPRRLAVAVSHDWISSNYTEQEHCFAFDSLEPENRDRAGRSQATIKDAGNLQD